jgi:hypothetical protein
MALTQTRNCAIDTALSLRSPVPLTRLRCQSQNQVDSLSNPREDAVLELRGEFMKTRNFNKMLVFIAVAGLALSASTALTQDSTTVAQPAVASATVPQMSYGAAQIVQLAQAKVSEDTIIAFIRNSGNSYSLDANQIIYLKQQGVSEAVITTMLNQPKTVVAATTPSTPATQSGASTVTTESGSTATVAPTVTYVQTASTPTYYSQPYYYPYYPAYAWYPPVVFSFGWGGGWHGGGWHGGGHR